MTEKECTNKITASLNASWINKNLNVKYIKKDN